MGNDAVTGIITHFSERHSPAKNASENMPFRRRGNAQPTRLRRSGLDVGGGFPRGVIAALWYEKIPPVHPFPHTPTTAPFGSAAGVLLWFLPRYRPHSRAYPRAHPITCRKIFLDIAFFFCNIGLPK